MSGAGMKAPMLAPKMIRMYDEPPGLFQYGVATWADNARTFEPFISAHLSDAEAWDALFTDEQRIAHAKAVYGNRPTRARAGRWARQDAEHAARHSSPATLFAAAELDPAGVYHHNGERHTITETRAL